MGLPDTFKIKHRQVAKPDDPDSRHAIEHADEVIHKEIPKKWTSYLWDTLDKPKEERWFMFKLDAALLTFASLGKLSLTELDPSRSFLQVISSNTWISRTSIARLSRECMFN